MSRISEAWVETVEDVYHFDHEHINEFMSFLKENPKDIVSIQITETMTREEYERSRA